EQLAHARKRLYILQVLVLVKFAPIFLQLLAERAHLARVEQIGNEQIAPFPDLMPDDVPLEVLPEMFERLDPTSGVDVVGIDERSVNVEDHRFEFHAMGKEQDRCRLWRVTVA